MDTTLRQAPPKGGTGPLRGTVLGMPANRRNLLRKLSISYRGADRLANGFAICASLLAALFLMSCVLSPAPNFAAGILGIICISLSRSLPHHLEWVSQKARKALRGTAMAEAGPVGRNTSDGKERRGR